MNYHRRISFYVIYDFSIELRQKQSSPQDKDDRMETLQWDIWTKSCSADNKGEGRLKCLFSFSSQLSFVLHTPVWNIKQIQGVWPVGSSS